VALDVIGDLGDAIGEKGKLRRLNHWPNDKFSPVALRNLVSTTDGQDPPATVVPCAVADE
jgi:hypothetical protein